MLIPNAARGVLVENGNRSRNGEEDHFPIIQLIGSDGTRYYLTEIDDCDIDLIKGLKVPARGPAVVDYFSIPQLENLGRRGDLKRCRVFQAMGPLSEYVQDTRALIAA